MTLGQARPVRAIILGIAAGALALTTFGPVPAMANTTPGIATRPFQFTITAPTSARPWFLHYDLGYADRATEAVALDGVEQTVGVEGPLPWGFRMLGRVALGFEDGNEDEYAWHVELLHNLIGSTADPEAFHLAFGAGVRRDWEETFVAIGRAVAGKQLGDWNVSGNVVLEKPFASERDELDIITTLATSWQAIERASFGVELIGEDWEGLWESEEAEGGAKLILGPTITALPIDHVLVSVIAGPVFHMTTSDSPEDSRGNSDTGFLVRLSAGYAF